MVLLIVSIVISFCVLVFATKWAADYLGAERTAYGWCALALVAASVLGGIGRVLPFGWLVALVLSALAYKMVLLTTLWKGLCIIIMQAVLGGLIMYCLVSVLGAFLR